VIGSSSDLLECSPVEWKRELLGSGQGGSDVPSIARQLHAVEVLTLREAGLAIPLQTVPKTPIAGCAVDRDYLRVQARPLAQEARLDAPQMLGRLLSRVIWVKRLPGNRVVE
jgi:hypothetical protein